MIARSDIRHPFYALTWWQPWGWAMFHGKAVENRTWHPPQWLRRQVVAVHAGKKYETAAYPEIQGLLRTGAVDAPCPTRGEIALGAVIGVARLVRSLDYRETPSVLPRPPAAGLCGCRGISHVPDCPYLSPWFCGPVGWHFEEALEFPHPIPATGHQGLWKVEGELLYRVLAAIDEGRAAQYRSAVTAPLRPIGEEVEGA